MNEQQPENVMSSFDNMSRDEDSVVVQNRPLMPKLGSAAAQYDPEHGHIIDAINCVENL